MSMPRDGRRPLPAGAAVNDDLSIERSVATGPAAFAYSGWSGAGRQPVEIVEAFPQGLAIRREDGAVVALTGCEAAFASRLQAFAQRAQALDALGHPFIAPAGMSVAEQGTQYRVRPSTGAVTLDSWCNDLLRRPSPEEVAGVVEAIADALACAHAAGLVHGAISAQQIQLTTAEDATLCGFMLGPPDGASAASDIAGFAATLYTMVTGRTPPEPQFAEARHAAAHIAPYDYPTALLQAIDAALGLGRSVPPVEPSQWLAQIRVAAGMAAPAPTVVVPVSARTSPSKPEAAVTPKPESAVPAAAKPRRLWPAVAAAVVLLAAGGTWLAMQLAPRLSPQPTPAAVTRPAEVAAAPPVATAPAPAPVAPAAPQPAPVVVAPLVAPPAPVAVAPVIAAPPPAPAPDPVAALAARVAAATQRSILLDLMAAGAGLELVTARLTALGYIPVVAGKASVLRRPGEAEAFSDCADCPELMLAPAGEVRMQIVTNTGPRSLSITLPKPFAAGRHEVTRAQFAAFVKQTGHAVQPGCHVRAPVWREDPRLSWQEPGYPQTDDDPVVCVSWNDAKAYAAWLSRLTGQRYRLLSDAEWHHLAARMADDLNNPTRLCAVGNGADETAKESNPGWTTATCRDGYLNTAPVGRFEASDWGLSDLSGNVWEWVETCAPDPTIPDQPFPPPTCRDNAPRILRGGSWADPPSLRTLDSRLVSAPGVRDHVAGFRIARDVGP